MIQKTLFMSGLILVSTLLGGCMHLSRTIEPERIFPAPSDTIDISKLPKAANGKICIKGKELKDGEKIPSELTQFSVAMYCLYQEPLATDDSRFWMKRFVDKGISLSNQTCELFFDDLEFRRVEASYSQTNLNIGGTAVTALIAATNNHMRTVLNLATLLTVGNAWFENYKSNYILTPQLRKLHDLIQTGLRDPIGNEIRSKNNANGYTSFDEAKQDVLKYDALCSHKVIQDVVNESVAVARFKPLPSGQDPDKTAKAEATKNDVYALAVAPKKGGQFAIGEFEALYVVATMPDAESRVKAAVALTQLVVEPYTTYITNLTLDKVSPIPSSILQFQYIGELLNLESNEKIKSARKEINDQMAKHPTPTPQPNVAALVSAPRVPPDPKSSKAFQDSLRAIQTKPATAINFKWELEGRR